MKMKLRLLFAMLAAVIAISLANAQDMPRFRWDNFTTANGLPDNQVATDGSCCAKACAEQCTRRQAPTAAAAMKRVRTRRE